MRRRCLPILRRCWQRLLRRNLTPPLPNGTATANQFQLINSAVLLNINNVQFSFGEQSQWLGPGEAGPLLMSNNAAPFPAFKIDDVAPHKIPGLSRILGPFRSGIFYWATLGAAVGVLHRADVPIVSRIPRRGWP